MFFLGLVFMGLIVSYFWRLGGFLMLLGFILLIAGLAGHSLTTTLWGMALIGYRLYKVHQKQKQARLLVAKQITD